MIRQKEAGRTCFRQEDEGREKCTHQFFLPAAFSTDWSAPEMSFLPFIK